MVCNRFDETRELGNNYIAVRQGYKWGLLDGNSNVFMRIIYDYISEENGMLWARYCGHKFNIPHEWLPMHYDCIYDFVEFAPKRKWAKVALNGKYGVINQDFAEIIPCEFDEITDYNGAIWAGKSLGKLEAIYAVYSYEGDMYVDCCYDGICYPVVTKTINGVTSYSIIDRQSKEILNGVKISTIRICKGLTKTLNLYDIERETGFHYLYSVEKGLKDIGYNTIENVKLYNKSFWIGYRFQYFPHYDDSTPKEEWLLNHNTAAIYGDVYFEDHYLLSYNCDECVLISHISDDYFVYRSERNSKYGIIGSHGYIIPSIYDKLSYEKELHIVVGVRECLLEGRYPAYEYSYKEQMYIRIKDCVGGIVDIYNEKGEIVIQEVDFRDWNPKKSYFCEGYLKLKIGEKQYIFKNKKMIVSPGQYDEVGAFTTLGWSIIDNEYAFVKKGDKWGVINSEGNLLIPVEYDEIKDFLKCRVFVSGHYYYKYKYLKAKKEGRCCFFEANKELKRIESNVIKDILDNNLVDYPDDYWRYNDEELLDKISDEIIKDKPKAKEMSSKWFRVIRNYQDSNCLIVEDIKSKKIGLLNENELKLCDFIYDSISDFNNDGIAIARIKGEGEGLIDQNGHIILPCKYKLYVGNNSNSRYRQESSMPEFTEGYLTISFDERFGLVDKKGHIVVPCEYPKFVTFQEYRQLEFLKRGYILVENDGYEGIIRLSSSDDYLLKCCYKEIEIHSNREHSIYGYDEPDSAKYIYGIGDNLCTVVDINTNTIVSNLHCSNVSSISIICGNYIIVEISQSDTKYYSIYTLYSQKHINDYSIIGYCNGRSVQVSKEGKWGIFDLELGKEIIPCEYYEDYEEENVAGAYYRWNHKIDPSFLLKSNSDYVVIRKNGKYGVIDNNNKCVIECKYDSVRPFKEGRAAVLIGFDWSFINEYGETIANGFEEVEDFSEGFAAVKKNGKWGYINTYGKTIIPYRFSKADSFSDGLAAVAFKTKYGYIDKHNKTIIPFKYEKAFSFEEGVAEVRNQDGSGTISKDGIIIDWKYKEKPYYDNTDYARDTWDAMTDGQYGDMPEGFDGDYDWLGY